MASDLVFDNEYRFVVAGYSRSIKQEDVPKEINKLIYAFCKSYFEWTRHSEHDIDLEINPDKENKNEIAISAKGRACIIAFDLKI